MKRRKLLIRLGSAMVGGSALLGSGAFTRVESQRRVKIEVAEDPNAYLGLDGCPDSPNQSYTNIDEDGHLEIEMSPSNPTAAGGEGVNSDSFSWFDDVFQVCNQGKQAVCVWIEAEPNSELPDPPEEYEDEPRLTFYIQEEDDGGELSLLQLPGNAVGRDNPFLLSVGECECIGIRTMTKELSAGDQLVENDEIVIHADANADCADGLACAYLSPEYDCTIEEDGEIVGTGFSVENVGNDAAEYGWAVLGSPNEYTEGARTVAAGDTETFAVEAGDPQDGIVWWEDDFDCVFDDGDGLPQEIWTTYAEFKNERGEDDDLVEYIENDTDGIPEDAFVNDAGLPVDSPSVEKCVVGSDRFPDKHTFG